eukprot:9667392-Ditylum_brightwellii.AAC.1
MQKCLCSSNTLICYASQNAQFAANGHAKPKKRQLVQFEAMIWLAMNLCFKSQDNHVEIGGEMVLILIALLAKDKGKDTNEYNVVGADNPTRWEATTSFGSLPVKMMTTMPEKKNRYIMSHKEYFKNIPDASIRAMIVNPILAIHGFHEIRVLLDDEAADDLKC